MSKRKLEDSIRAPPKKKLKTQSTSSLANRNNFSLDDCLDDDDNDNDNDEQSKAVTISTSNDPIILNIGGYRFETSLMTLTGIKDCVFSKMFNGNFSTKPNSKNEYFIDRDGEYFKYILNFMRTNTLILPNQDMFLINCLYQEAVYYQIQPLIKVLDDKRGKTLKIYNSTIYNPTILNESAFKKLSSLFDIKKYKFNLLVKFNQMDYNNEWGTFQSQISAKCNGVYPILFLVKLSDDIVGIYCNEPKIKWGQYKGSTGGHYQRPIDDYHVKKIWTFYLEPEPVKHQFVRFEGSGYIIIHTTQQPHHQFAIWPGYVDYGCIRKNWACFEVYHCKN